MKRKLYTKVNLSINEGTRNEQIKLKVKAFSGSSTPITVCNNQFKRRQGQEHCYAPSYANLAVKSFSFDGWSPSLFNRSFQHDTIH